MTIRATVARVIKKTGIVVGLRRLYYFEVLSSSIAAAVNIVVGIRMPWSPAAYAAAALLLVPLLYQAVSIKTGRLPSISIPLYTVIMGTIASLFNPIALVFTVANALLVEDFLVFLPVSVSTLRMIARRLLAPLTVKELLTLNIVNISTALVSYAIMNNPIVFIYPMISYAFMAYSMFILPPALMPREPAATLIESIARRIPALYHIFIKLYSSSKMIRLAKEAGVLGAEYDRMMTRVAGQFVVVTYIALAASPILYLLPGYGHLLAAVVPLAVPSVWLVAPYVRLRAQRAARRSKLSRNFIFILTYLAAMTSVSETFSEAMFNLKRNPGLAKLFGLEREVNIYHTILTATGEELTAVEEYADTVPDEMYRDVLKTYKSLIETEGYGAAFNMLVTRLREYVVRYVEQLRTRLSSIVQIGVTAAILPQVGILVVGLFNPILIPLSIIVMTPAIGYMFLVMVKAVLPELPSEFVYAKQRAKVAGTIASITGSTMLILSNFLYGPGYTIYVFPATLVAAVAAGLVYMHHRDITVNRQMLDKLSDILVMFYSSFGRHQAVDRALEELASDPALPYHLRAELRNMAAQFATLDPTRIFYHGPFWVKFFKFLASIGATYGTTPRTLYRAMSEFAFEVKKVWAIVKGPVLMAFAVTLLLSFLQATFIANVKGLYEVFAGAGEAFKATQAFGVTLPFSIPSREELEVFKNFSIVAITVGLLANGLVVARLESGTIRYPRLAIPVSVLSMLVPWLLDILAIIKPG